MLTLLLLICSFIGLEAGSTNFINKNDKVKRFDQKQWFIDNIPFVELPDKNIEEVYYYRWSSHKRHLRYTTLGAGFMVTEFSNKVWYENKFDSINAAAGHHIYESRWLRDSRFVKDNINFYARQNDDDGNHRYSEWIADSAWSSYLLLGEKELLLAQKDQFAEFVRRWRNNFEPKLGLYWISGLLDAQEYSCASIPTRDPFGGGVGYRPSFNAEIYGNAMAVKRIAELAGDNRTAKEFETFAKNLRENIIKRLWDAKRQYFFHVQRLDNPKNLPLDSQEEIGMYPWRWHVPDNRFNFSVAWNKLFDPKIFYTKYGPATCDIRSKWADVNQRPVKCCWWNGNSWPYSTSIVLSSLAEQIKHYKHQAPGIGVSHYFDLLKKYAMIHYKNGKPYVAECHSPINPFWVCDTRNHSEHYAHSTFNDNVLGELIGIIPHLDDKIEIRPLVPNNWTYFLVENVLYHGHNITVMYDKNGRHYKQGPGLRVYVDGELKSTTNLTTDTSLFVPIAKPIVVTPHWKSKENYAANVKRSEFPKPTSSFYDKIGTTWQAVDGRIFFDSVPSNRWSNWKSPRDFDWFAIDFGPGRAKTIDSVDVYFFVDVPPYGNGQTNCPTNTQVQYYDGKNWVNVVKQSPPTNTCIPNDVTRFQFSAVKTQQVRLVLTRNKTLNNWVGFTEVEVWADWPQVSQPHSYEAEDAIAWSCQILSSGHASGNSYVGRIDRPNSGVEFSGIRVAKSGNYKLRVFYANAFGKPGSHKLRINNMHHLTVNYPKTSKGWGHFDDQTFVELTVPLLYGDNVLLFQKGNNFAELDKIQVVV